MSSSAAAAVQTAVNPASRTVSAGSAAGTMRPAVSGRLWIIGRVTHQPDTAPSPYTRRLARLVKIGSPVLISR